MIYHICVNLIARACQFDVTHQQCCTFEQTLNHPTPSLRTYALQLGSSSRTGNKTVFKPPSTSLIIQPSCPRFRSKHIKSYVCWLNCDAIQSTPNNVQGSGCAHFVRNSVTERDAPSATKVHRSHCIKSWVWVEIGVLIHGEAFQHVPLLWVDYFDPSQTNNTYRLLGILNASPSKQKQQLLSSSDPDPEKLF